MEGVLGMLAATGNKQTNQSINSYAIAIVLQDGKLLVMINLQMQLALNSI